MNQTIKKVNEEKILFFDCEVVRNSRELDVNSKEFELFQKKTRDRVTDALLPEHEVVDNYEKRGALQMCYTKIVSIGVGFIKNGKVHIKALDGEEGDIIKDFCSIASNFDYVCGVNILGYDLPMLSNNGYRHFDVCGVLPDRFVVSGKKPWNLERVLDLMDIFKGTHYNNSSLDEMCYHFNISSPKTDISGANVSKVFYEEGIDRINKYVKQDVFATINLFKKMRFQDVFENFLDKDVKENNNIKKTADKKEEVFKKEEKVDTREPEDVLFGKLPILHKILNATEMTDETKEELTAVLRKKKPTKKDKVILEDILVNLYVNQEMFRTDKPELQASKRAEIVEILNKL